ncbi:MAG: hypothetical protein R3E68_15635 [Burkholderiaceae bacterium]
MPEKIQALIMTVLAMPNSGWAISPNTRPQGSELNASATESRAPASASAR